MKTVLSVQDLLNRGEDEFGELPALLGPDGACLTYHELNRQSRYVKTVLRESGVGSDARVALLLPHGGDFAACLVSVASCATCAPLDPGITRSELRMFLEQLNAAALISCTHQSHPLLEMASEAGITLIELTPSSQNVPGQFTLRCAYKSIRRSATDRNAHANDHAVILPTSGTTSRPKLVPQSHRSVLSAAADLAAWFGLSPADRALGCMPLFHGNGLFVGFFPVLLSGGSVICMDSFAPEEFFRCLQKHDPTWFTTIPTYLQALLRESERASESIASHRLRFIRVGSAHLNPDLMKAAESVFSVPIIAGYGSAEALYITNNPLPPRPRKSGSVGLPDGQDVQVVDPQGNPLEAGTIGEVAVRGPSLTPGYLDDAQANEGLFHDGWLRTGDAGYFDADGYLTLVGRKKQMINRGGESISPFEIEAAILSHHAVAEAAVFPVPHPTLGESVGAAIVLHVDSELSHFALRLYLADKLSPQKIPYRFLEVTNLPTNSIGKVKHSELVERFLSEPEGIAAEPETESEKYLAGLFRDVLGCGQVGVNDNFFDLGGDSLSGALIISRIARNLAVDLPMTVLFQHPTVAELAGALDKAPRMRMDE